MLQPMLHHQTIEKSVIYDKEDQNDNVAGPSIESQNVFVKEWYYGVKFFWGGIGKNVVRKTRLDTRLDDVVYPLKAAQFDH